MMLTHWISDIMPVVVLMPTHKYGGTVMMMKSLKLVICQNVYIPDRTSQKNITMKKVMSGS